MGDISDLFVMLDPKVTGKFIYLTILIPKMNLQISYYYHLNFKDEMIN